MGAPIRRKVNYNIGGKEPKLEALLEKEKPLGKSESSAAEDDVDGETETAADFIASNRSKKGIFGGSKQSLTVRKKPSTTTITLSTSALNKNETSQRRIDRGDGDAGALEDVRKPTIIKSSIRNSTPRQDKPNMGQSYKEDFEQTQVLQKDNDSVDINSFNADDLEENSNVDVESDVDEIENDEIAYEEEMNGEDIGDEEIEDDGLGDEDENESESDMVNFRIYQNDNY